MDEILRVVYPVPSLRIGGAEQQLLELVRGLDKRRFQPIVTPLVPNGALEPEFRAVPGVEIIQLNRRGRWDFSPIWRLATLLRLLRVDVVQPYLPPATTFGLLAGLLAGTTIKALTERSGVGREMSFYVRLQDRLTRFADCHIANSEAGRDSLIQRGVPRNKIHVIVNGINLERLRVNEASVREFRARLAVPSGGRVVGILASLLPVKLHDIFVRAAAQVGERWPGARYAIFGGGPLLADLQTLAFQLGIASRVVFFGYQRNVADCIAACDLLVSSSRVEGLSNAILEAMALGVPVVASDIPGNRELVQHQSTGCLVPVGDVCALAVAIDAILAHPDEAWACAERAKGLIATRFSVQRMAYQHQALYESLLRAKRPASLTTGV